MRDRNNQMFMPYDNNGFFPYMPNDIESRIDSLERMVKRLEQRVNRLENTNTTVYTNEYNTSLPDVYNQNIYPNAMHMM